MPDTQPTNALLDARGSTHGDFTTNSAISHALKLIMRGSPNWPKLSATQTEALEMIVHKISRALAGDHDHEDHWRDIAGYATLAADRLPKR